MLSFLGNPEYQLIAAGVPRGGWEGERAQLPQDAEDAAVRTIGGVLLSWRVQEFRRHLRAIFAQMVAAEGVHQNYRMRAGVQPPCEQSGGRRRVAKFGTVARAALANFEDVYRELSVKRHPSHPTMVRFFRRLRQDPVVFGLLSAAASREESRRLRLWFHPPARRGAFKAVAIANARLALARAMRPGASDPVYEQMVRALAGLFFQCTGRKPRRSYDAIAEQDAGPFLQLCQIMAMAINDAQPAAIKRLAAPRMAKTVRRVIEEFAAEQEVSS